MLIEVCVCVCVLALKLLAWDSIEHDEHMTCKADETHY